VVTNTGAATTATLPQAWASWAPFCEAEDIDLDVSGDPEA